MISKWLSVLALTAIASNVHAQKDTPAVKNKKDTVMRSLPSPLPNPPFPTADWDGAPLVGVDATPHFKIISYSLSVCRRDPYTAANHKG
jgi:hypothetical protein